MPYYGYGGYGAGSMPPRAPMPARPQMPAPVPPIGEEDELLATAPKIASSTRNYAPSAASLLPPSLENPMEIQAGLQEEGPANPATAVATRVNTALESPPDSTEKKLFQAPNQRLMPTEVSLGQRANEERAKRTNTGTVGGPIPKYGNADLKKAEGQGIFNVSGNPLVPDREEADLNRAVTKARKVADVEQSMAVADDPTGSKGREQERKAEYDMRVRVAQETARGKQRDTSEFGAKRNIVMQTLDQRMAQIDAAVSAGQMAPDEAAAAKAKLEQDAARIILNMERQATSQQRNPPLSVVPEAPPPTAYE